MKIGKISQIALLGGALVAPTYADKVKLNQLPADLQARIQSQTGGARVEDIDRDVRNGKTRYEVAFKNAQGQNQELVFEEPVTSATPAAAGATTLDSRKLRYDELPANVRQVVDAQVNGGEINDVERNVKNGQVIYGIGFKGPNGTGPQRELMVDSEGRLVRGRRSNWVGSSANNPAATTATAPVTSSSTGASTPVNGVTRPIASKTISYNDVPQSVQNVASTHLNHGNVEYVERQVNNGEIDYLINFKRDDGQYQKMVIAEDGRILSNQMLTAAAAASPSAIGSAGTVQSGATASSTPLSQGAQYSSVRSPVPLRNSVVVDRSQVPAEVRRVIRDETRNANVEEILQGDWSGKQVYQIAFTDENKKYVEIQVDNNGQLIYDPRITGATSTPTATPATKTGTVLQNLGRALLDPNAK